MLNVHYWVHKDTWWKFNSDGILDKFSNSESNILQDPKYLRFFILTNGVCEIYQIEPHIIYGLICWVSICFVVVRSLMGL